MNYKPLSLGNVETGDPGTKTRIYQPNRITNASYDYTLLQSRIMSFVIFALQHQIERVMNGTYVHQLDIFKGENTDEIHIIIPMKAITSAASQYRHIIEAAKDMVSRVITMRGKDLYNRDTIEFTGLFSSVITHQERSGILQVSIKRRVAEMLVDIDRNAANKPINYTGYILEIALKSRNKYTPRIYQFISSWKEKGGVRITLDDLRTRLQLDDKYKDYNLFKRRVLEPAQKELKEMADCWFNMSDLEEIKQGRKVVELRFKIVNVTIDKQRELLLHNLYNDILPRFKLVKAQIENLSPIFERCNIYEVIEKLSYLQAYILDNHADPTTRVNNIPAYVYNSLMKEFNR